jgi:hypothetical protein
VSHLIYADYAAGTGMEDVSQPLYGIKIVKQIERKYKRLFMNESYVRCFVHIAVQVADNVEYLRPELVAVEELKQLSEAFLDRTTKDELWSPPSSFSKDELDAIRRPASHSKSGPAIF